MSYRPWPSARRSRSTRIVRIMRAVIVLAVLLLLAPAVAHTFGAP
jgi:hypothetical protein